MAFSAMRMETFYAVLRWSATSKGYARLYAGRLYAGRSVADFRRISCWIR